MADNSKNKPNPKKAAPPAAQPRIITDQDKKDAEDLNKLSEEYNQLQKDQKDLAKDILTDRLKQEKINKRILDDQRDAGLVANVTNAAYKLKFKLSSDIASSAETLVYTMQQQEEILKRVNAALDNEEKKQYDIVQLERKRRNDLKDTVNLVEEYDTQIRDLSVELQGISKEGVELTKRLDASGDILVTMSGITGKVAEHLKNGVRVSDDFVKTLEEAENTTKDLVDLGLEMAKNAEKAAKGEYDHQGMTDKLLERRKKLQKDELAFQDKVKKFQENREKMTHEEIRSMQLELGYQKKILEVNRNAIDAREAENASLKKITEEAKETLGVFDKMTSGDFKGALLQKFRLDDINKQVKQKIGGALVNVIKEIRADNLVGAFSAAGKGLKDMISMAPKLLAALGIGAIVMLGNFLIDTFTKADKEISQLGKDFGISKKEAKELHHATVDVANQMKITGIHSEEVAKSLKTVSDNLGGIDLTEKFSSGNAAVQQMVKDTTILTEKFGLSGEEAGNLNNIAAITGKSVGEMSMMATTLGKGMFSAKESMKILAGIPKSIVSQMSKMPEAMIKTAMHAKALGMNMKQIAEIGRKSLDIEQSLEAEMEARAIIGKDINLDTMRAAALQGDQETVMKELLNAAGSMKEFNDMNVLQKEALAKAAGMEVDQLAEMLGKQEELNNSGLSMAQVQELQKKNSADLAGLAAKESSAGKKAFLERLTAEKKSEETQAQMASLMKRIQELAVKLVTPLMDVVDSLMDGKDGASAMDGVFNLIGGTIKLILPVIKLIASAISGMIKPLTWFLGLFSSTEEKTEEIGHQVANVKGGIDKVTTAVKPTEAGFGGILKALGMIGGFFFGKALLVKGFGLLKDTAVDVGKTIMSKIGGALSKVGGKALEKTGGVIGKIGGKFGGKVGGKLMGGESAVSAAEKSTDKIKGVGDKMKGIGKGIAEIGKGIGQAFKGIITGIGEGLKSLSSLANPATIAGIIIFTGAMIGLGYAFKLLGEGIGAAAPGIKAFFEGIGGIIQKVGEAIAKVIETITTSVIRLQNIDGKKMMAAALGIYAIAGALAYFGGGSLFAGLGSALGKLFDEDPVDKFNRFAKIDAKGLDAVAKAILMLGQAMQTFSNVSGGLNLDKVDQMVEKIEKLKSAQTSAAISNLATTAIGGLTSIVGGLFGSSEKQTTQPVSTTTPGGTVAVAASPGGTNMTNVEKKLDTLISLFSQAAGQPTVIKFGDKTVEEFKSALNFKKAYNIGIDNTYGRSI